jgi:hypothetical protein
VSHLRRFSTPAVLAALLFGNLRCSSALGIEDAKCDPALPECSPDAPSRLCQDYCSAVMTNCTDDNAVYESVSTCHAVCKLLDPGEEGTDSGNTVRCRLRQAIAAGPEGVNEPDSHCAGAGPGGEGADGEALCADNCDGYCSLMMAACDDFSSVSACRKACRDVPDLGGYNTSHSEGDSLQCRLWHLSAASLEPNPHCLHAAGKSYCVP